MSGWGRLAVVVAHPDDEILWLSSVLEAAERTVLCFGAPFERPVLAAARRRAVAALPLAGIVDLGIPESGAGFDVDRLAGRPTSFGIEIEGAAARARYEANFGRLVDALRPVLVGFDAVATHNPWGEYGHAEHVQVHRAVMALAPELGFSVWFSNYVGTLSWPLARRLARAPCWTERRAVVPDAALGRRVMRVYRKCGAWTWRRFHRWPAGEMLYRAGDGRAMAGELLFDVRRLRPAALPLDPVKG